MKISSQAQFTLSPVPRAAAFFAFLMTLFILPSCGEEDPRAANMAKQAATYQGLAEVMNQLSEGKDVPSAAHKVSELVVQMMTLKKESNSMAKPEGDVALEALQNNETYSEAVTAFFEAQKKLTQSGKMTAEIFAALQGFHKAPEPLVGEGRN